MLAGSSPSWISSFSTRRFCAAYSSPRLSIAAGSILALPILSPPPWPVSARKPPLRRFCPAYRNAAAAFFSTRSAIVRTEQSDAAILYPLRQESQRILQTAAAGRQKPLGLQPNRRAGIRDAVTRFAISPAQT